MGVVDLKPSQIEAVGRIATGPQVMRLVGLAGTGKTTIALRLPEMLGWDLRRTVFAAPTWRAISVLQGKARKAGRSLPASTSAWALTKKGAAMVHCDDCVRLGGASAGLCHKVADSSLACACRELDADGASPRDIDEKYDNVIMDEASMLGVRDWADITRQLGSIRRMILVGDHGQLPPVISDREKRQHGVADGWSVLTLPDICEVELTEILRQGDGSPIIDLAHTIRNRGWDGPCTLTRSRSPVALERLDPSGTVLTSQAPRGWGGGTDEGGYPALAGYAEVTFTHKVRAARTVALRAGLWGNVPRPIELGELVRTGSRDTAGRYVKHTRGSVLSIRRQATSHTVCDVLLEDGIRLEDVTIDHRDLLDDRASGSWSYGYVSTVHTAQGGEHREVTYLTSKMDSPRLAYTAVTRAMEKLNVIGY